MTNQNQKTVAVFDLDNTLIDSGAKLKADVVGAMARLGYEMTPEDIGKDWYAMADSYGISKEQFDEAFNQRKTWEESLQDGEVPMFRDTTLCLEALRERGIRLGLLSKSIPKYTQAKLDYFGLGDYFEQVETVHPKEPSKIGGAEKIIQNMAPETMQSAWFIGDKPEDVTVAKDIKNRYELSTGGIYVNRSARPVPEEAAEYHSVRSLDEIPEIIGE